MDRTARAVLTMVLLALSVGCRSTESPAATVPTSPTEPVAMASSNQPSLQRAETPESAPAISPTPSSESAPEPVLTLDATRDQPVRGRLRSGDLWTHVEVCVNEITVATSEQPALVRFTMRLCTEDGRTEAVAMRWSKESGWKTLFTDTLYEAGRDSKAHVFFECPYGTAWVVDATAERVEADRARLVIRGEWRACTR